MAIMENKSLKGNIDCVYGNIDLSNLIPVNLKWIRDVDMWLIDHKNNPNLQSRFYGKNNK